MDELNPTMESNHSTRDKELINIFETGDLYNKEGRVENIREFEIRILHHNVQSLYNKLLDIKMMLTIDNLNANMLCLMEHWLCEDQMNVLNIDQFKLVSKFCRSSSASGGSCIFTKNTLQTKEINYLSSLGSVKVFGVSAVELADFGIILACIYRSPDSDFYEFLGKLEALITRVFSKGKRLILCGDLNINFLKIVENCKNY